MMTPETHLDGRCEVVRFDSAAALVRAAAQEWLATLAQLRSEELAPTVALSGGRIAEPFFSELVAQSSGNLELWNGVQVFWADERCVPPDHPESNYAAAREALIVPLRIPDASVHRVRGELAPAAAAAEAEAALRAVRSRPGGKPFLDLVWLGLGEDGHVASLFPGESSAAMQSPALYRAVVGPKPPPNRVTLGYGVLKNAPHVLVLVSGSGKQAAVAASLRAGAATPLGRVLRERNFTRVFTDQP